MEISAENLDSKSSIISLKETITLPIYQLYSPSKTY